MDFTCNFNLIEFKFETFPSLNVANYYSR